MSTIQDLADNKVYLKNDFNAVIRLMAQEILELKKQVASVLEANSYKFNTLSISNNETMIIEANKKGGERNV